MSQDLDTLLREHQHLRATQNNKIRCSFTGQVMENDAHSVMEYLNSKKFKAVRGPRKNQDAWERLLAPKDRAKWRDGQIIKGLKEAKKPAVFSARERGKVRDDGFFNRDKFLGDCDEYKDPSQFGLQGRARGKRFTCEHPERGTQTPVFGTYEYKPDPYHDAGHAHMLARRENRKKIEQMARKPFSSVGPNITGLEPNPFNSEVDKHTFTKKTEINEFVKGRRQEQAPPQLGPNPTVRTSQPNILTNPPVKGTYGYSQTTLEEGGRKARMRDAMSQGKIVQETDMTITHKPDGYELEKEKRRLRRIKIKKNEVEPSLAAQAVPYKIMNTGTPYFDSHTVVYGDTERVLKERKMRPASAPISRETRRKESILDRYERIKALRVEELKRQQKSGHIKCVGPAAREDKEGEGEGEAVQRPAFRPSHPVKKGKVGAAQGISMGKNPPYMSDPIPQPRYRRPEDKDNFWIPNHTTKSSANKTVMLNKMNIAELSVENDFHKRPERPPPMEVKFVSGLALSAR